VSVYDSPGQHSLARTLAPGFSSKADGFRMRKTTFAAAIAALLGELNG
jgi:hypothetical protein